jgi:membrane protease YdiL (CAAX protease family)
LFVPLFETFLFQQLPFKIMQNWSLTTNRYGIYILLSAIIFGLFHWYSLQYMIFAFAVGLVLGYTYFFYCKTPKVAFWSTVLIHGLRNLIVYIAIWFDK